MRTLVTGGTGLVGRFVVERLLDAGHEVTVWGRTPPDPAQFSRPVSFRAGDLEPDQDHGGLFEGVTGLVHAAFDHAPGKYRGGEASDPDGFIRRNRDGSVALFRAARQSGVARAVFLSSRAVYGVQPAGEPLRETTPTRPDSLYGTVKLETEQALEDLGDEGFRVVSLRVTGVYGAPRPGLPHKWEELFRDFLAGRPIEPRVAGEVHGFDVAQATRLALEAQTLSDFIFNVSDLVLDRHDLLAQVNASLGMALTLPPRADASTLNVMDTSRLAALGWRPGGSALLQRSVAEMVRSLA